VQLVPFYNRNELKGPLTAREIAVVEDHKVNATQARVRGHTYERDMLRLKDTDHIQGYAIEFIGSNTGIGLLVLQSLCDTLKKCVQRGKQEQQEAFDWSTVDIVCKCLSMWRYVGGPTETAVTQSVLQHIVALLSFSNVPIRTLCVLLQCISAMKPRTQRLQGLFPNHQPGTACVTLNRSVSCLCHCVLCHL
jgi:hypothetical protein